MPVWGPAWPGPRGPSPNSPWPRLWCMQCTIILKRKKRQKKCSMSQSLRGLQIPLCKDATRICFLSEGNKKRKTKKKNKDNFWCKQRRNMQLRHCSSKQTCTCVGLHVHHSQHQITAGGVPRPAHTQRRSDAAERRAGKMLRVHNTCEAFYSILLSCIMRICNKCEIDR